VSSKAYREWQAENDQLQLLADSVDVLLPSLYTFYDDQDGWVRYAISTLSEARRLSKGKPVYAFIWPQYHNSNPTLALKLIDGAFWAKQLQVIAAHADGAVIWGGWQTTWDDQSAWWRATLAFMHDSVQPCKKPAAPTEFAIERQGPPLR
jgi:hypothetical protein